MQTSDVESGQIWTWVGLLVLVIRPCEGEPEYECSSGRWQCYVVGDLQCMPMPSAEWVGKRYELEPGSSSSWKLVSRGA